MATGIISVVARRNQSTDSLAPFFSTFAIEENGAHVTNMTSAAINFNDGGMITLTLTRLRIRDGAPILRDGPDGQEAETYTERYGLDALFANGWRLLDAEEAAISADIKGAPA